MVNKPEPPLRTPKVSRLKVEVPRLRVWALPLYRSALMVREAVSVEAPLKV
jgi:hypothetical protein